MGETLALPQALTLSHIIVRALSAVTLLCKLASKHVIMVEME